MEELERWGKIISSFDRLSIKEGRELYKKAIITDDEASKNELINNIVQGTLYVVYNYIKRNNLDLLCSEKIDMNDIISAFNEVWIKKIKEGELLKVDNYSYILDFTFLSEVYSQLCGENITVIEKFGFSSHYFVDILSRYIECKRKEEDFDYKDILDKHYSKSIYYHQVSESTVDIIPVLDKIYMNLDLDNNDHRLNKRKLLLFSKILLMNGIIDKEIDDVEDDHCFEDECVQEDLLERFKEEICEVFTKRKQQDVIFERYGLDGSGPKNLQEVADIHGLTRERIRQIEHQGLRRLRGNKKLRKYKGEY